MTTLRITDETTRADERAETLTALHNVNTRAKTIRRRGLIGIRSDEYKRRHADIDRLLTELYPEPLP